MWGKVNIKIKDAFYEGVEPLVLSVSRSTDIPAFHAEWFMRRLDAGYIKWINPFNRKAQYVSLDKVKFIVFWTKNPRPILPYLEEIKNRGISFYFQYTLNNYESEGLEPFVPSVGERIETFIELSEKIGKEKVVWRNDPLLLSHLLSLEVLLERTKVLGDILHKYTEKLVFSFIDIGIYSKVKKNLDKLRQGCREFSEVEMKQFASGLVGINSCWNLQLATCGEKSDFSNLGIKHNKCIDDELILRILPNDKDVCQLLCCDSGQGTLIPIVSRNSKTRLKDKGQRKECGCIVSKDIGQYNTCMHLCAYCYANHSESIVRRNACLTSAESDTIVADGL